MLLKALCLFVFLRHGVDSNERIRSLDVQDSDALRRAAHERNRVGLDAEGLALARDAHDLVGILNRDKPDDLPGFLGNRIDLLTAGRASVRVKLGEVDALTVPALGHDEHAFVVPNAEGAGELIVARELDAGNAARCAPERADILFGHAERLSLAGDQHDLVLARREGCADELIPVIELDRDDPARFGVLEVARRDLLDDAFRGRHQEILGLAEVLQRDDRGYLLVGGNGEERLDVRSPARPVRLGYLVDLDPVRLTRARDEHDVIVGRRRKELIEEVILG